MRIIAKSTLRAFWIKYPDSEFALLDWYNTVCGCNWKNPNEVKNVFTSASIIGNNRIIFNIKGNKYRLITQIQFEYQILFIIWVGSHRDYDKIDALKIQYDGKP